LPKRQVVCLLWIIDTLTSLPSTYVWAFGFVGFILFSTGNHKLQPRAEKTEMKMKSKWRCFKKNGKSKWEKCNEKLVLTWIRTRPVGNL
jgi:hypothetical protein